MAADRILLDPGVRLDPTNAHRLARKARTEIGVQDDRWCMTPIRLRHRPRKPGVGAERFARDFLRDLPHQIARHYDRATGLLHTIAISSMGGAAPVEVRDCACLALDRWACALSALPLQQNLTLLVALDHAVGRALERLAIPGPRDVVSGVPARWLEALRRGWEPEGNIVLPLSGGQRPGLLRCQWAPGSQVLVARTAIHLKPGSRAEQQHAELSAMIAAVPAPKLGDTDLTPLQRGMVHRWAEISRRGDET